MTKKWTLILALLVALTAATAVSAAEIPDPEQPGSITFTLEWEGKPLHGGSLTLYRVGDVVFAEDRWQFQPVEGLPALDLSEENLGSPELAQQLADAAAEGLEPLTVPILSGTAAFPGLLPGLYVVTQAESSDGFSPIRPFLISLPQWDGENYVYHITAAPKVGLQPEPTEPDEPTRPSDPSDPSDPTEPEEPDLPQTGQLNWPVPVMAVAGLLLVMLGWALCSGRKERREN